jgi:hypothetical protein
VTPLGKRCGDLPKRCALCPGCRSIADQFVFGLIWHQNSGFALTLNSVAEWSIAT